MAAGSALGLPSWLLWPALGLLGLLRVLGAADTLTALQHAAKWLCAGTLSATVREAVAMMLYKAVRPDGGSFNDPSFRWAVEPGGITTHPLYGKPERKDADGAAGYLSVATVPTDCTGMTWPCRLLWVEPVGRLWTPEADGLPNKRAGLRFRTVKELPASDVFGEQDIHVAALIARAGTLTGGEAAALAAAWDAAWYAARDAAWDAAWDAARAAARYAAWDAAWDAARGLVVRDLISAEHYDTLTLPWRTTIGSIHPGDAVVTA